MNKIMRNSLAIGIIGFFALSACANKKNTTTTRPAEDKKEVKPETKEDKNTTPLETTPIDIAKDRTACELPWGPPEQETENRRNYGYMQAKWKSRDYTSGYENWKHLVKNSPCGTINIYKIGEVILKDTIAKEKDSIKRLALIKDLNQNFRQRIQYFGQESKQKERWAKLLYNVAPWEYDIINDNLEETINRDGDTTESDIMIYYLNNSFQAYNDKKIGSDLMFEKYSKLSDIVEYNIETYENDSIELARWQALESNLDLIIAKVGTCDDLFKQFKPELEEHSKDQDWLNKAEKALRAKKCTKEDKLYIDVLEKLYAIDPSIKVAKRLAKYYYGIKNNTLGNKYWNGAIGLETDPIKKSSMYSYLASRTLRAGNASGAKSYADKALSLNSRNGSAYLTKGSALYKICRSTCSGFDKKACSYIMMEYALKAKAADSRVAAQANRTYNRYSAYKPTKEEIFFIGRKVGDSYTIKCIGVKVILR